MMKLKLPTFDIRSLAIIIVLLFLLCVQHCKRTEPGKDVHHYHTDSFYSKQDTFFKKIVSLSFKDTGNVWTFVDTFVVIDSSCDFHKQQLIKLAKLYATKNIYNDTLLIDTFGHVYITDTVQFNSLLKRNYHLTYQFQTSIVYNNKPFWFVGGTIYTNKNQSGISGNVGYKTYKNNIYTLNVLGINQQLYYGIGFQKQIK